MEQRIKLNSTPINGPYLIETSKKVDSRGDFTRLFCDTELSQVFSEINIKQINCSRNSHKGTIRGATHARATFSGGQDCLLLARKNMGRHGRLTSGE